MLWLIHQRLRSKNAAARREAVEELCKKPHPHLLRLLTATLDEGANANPVIHQ